MTETLIVMASLPFALVGGLWLVWYMGFNLSVAVAVGFIALAGVAAETGVVMLIYLDNALSERTRTTEREVYALIKEWRMRRARTLPEQDGAPSTALAETGEVSRIEVRQ